MSNLTAEILHMNDVIKKCGCDCHESTTSVMHCMPCCDYTYQKEYLENCAICGNTLTDDKNATWHYSTNHNSCDASRSFFIVGNTRITPSQIVNTTNYNSFVDRSDKEILTLLNIDEDFLFRYNIQFMEMPASLHFENSRRYYISAKSYKQAADSEFLLNQFAYLYCINYSGSDVIVRGALKKDIDTLLK